MKRITIILSSLLILFVIGCQKDPTCSDGVQNGDETGVDCGGTLCPVCSTGGGNTTPTCTDGIMNGTETGIDCGGSCSPCGTTDTDCLSFSGCNFQSITNPDLSMFVDSVVNSNGTTCDTYKIFNGNITTDCEGLNANHSWCNGQVYGHIISGGIQGFNWNNLQCDVGYFSGGSDTTYFNSLEIGTYSRNVNCVQPYSVRVSRSGGTNGETYISTSLTTGSYTILEVTKTKLPIQIPVTHRYRIRGRVSVDNLKLDTDTTQTVSIQDLMFQHVFVIDQ